MSRIASFAALLLAFASPSLRADGQDLDSEPAQSAVAWSGDLLLRQDWLRSWRPFGDNESRLLVRCA